MSILRMVALGLAVCLSGACGHDDAWQQRRAKTKAELAVQRARFASIIAAWPEDPSPSQPCAVADVVDTTSAQRVLVVMDWDFLKANAEASAPPIQAHAASMTHQKLQRLNENDPSSVLGAQELLDQRPFLAVWRATEFEVPRIATTERFAGGHARGRLVIFDVRRPAALCWMTIEAKSSPEVTYKIYKQEVDSQALAKADIAVSVDLVAQVQAAIESTLPTISRALQVTPLSYIQ